MVATIDLQTFLDGYKTAEVVLGDKKRVFREPALKDMGLKIQDMLEKYCLEGDTKELLEIITKDMPISKRQEVLNSILNELGLV